MLVGHRWPVPAVATLVASLAFGAVGVWVGVRTNYLPALNDFWPLLFQSNLLDWQTRASFANGFFPPGYATFLRAIGGEHVLAWAFWSNLAFAIGTSWSTYWLARRLASEAAAAAAAVAVLLHPLLFSLGLTTGADAGCIFFASAGLFLVMAGGESDSERTRRTCWWSAAALFFFAGLWRYHGLVFAVAAILGAAPVYRRASLWRVAGGVVALALVFAAFSLLPGLSSQLEKAQAFGAYKAGHAINWYHVPRDFPPTVAAVIQADPEAFWRGYAQFNLPLLWTLVPPALAAVLLRGAPRRVAACVLLLEALYLPIVGIGASPRGVAPVLPATMLCAALLLDALARPLAGLLGPRAPALAATLALAVVAVPWSSSNRAFVEGSIEGYEWRRAVEIELRAQGVSAPLQVFGDAGFHFVINHGPGWYSYFPHFNGGWPRLDLYRLQDVLPEMATGSLDVFLADCERAGVTHVVLSASAGYLLPALDGIFHRTHAEPRMTFTAEVGGMRIFRLAR